VYEFFIQFIILYVVLLRCNSYEKVLKDESFQRLETGHHNIDTHIIFMTSKKMWLLNVSLYQDLFHRFGDVLLFIIYFDAAAAT